MTENKTQHVNIENFVRENASTIARHAEENPNTSNRYGRIYKCKDCDKEYNSFQALGGHRASHRNVRTATGDDGSGIESLEPNVETKQHECKICGKKFAIGQELGGHMRKHWRERNNDHTETRNEGDLNNDNIIITEIVADSSSSSSISHACNPKGNVVFEYDLNLTPYENELRLDRGITIENPRDDHRFG